MDFMLQLSNYLPNQALWCVDLVSDQTDIEMSLQLQSKRLLHCLEFQQ